MVAVTQEHCYFTSDLYEKFALAHLFVLFQVEGYPSIKGIMTCESELQFNCYHNNVLTLPFRFRILLWIISSYNVGSWGNPST